MAAGPSDTAVHVRIAGRVQGVWFRGWTVEEARARDLDGWVRNRADGTVEAVFAGPRAVVDDMVALCWRGPPAAVVRDVKVALVAPPAEIGFRVLPTM